MAVVVFVADVLIAYLGRDDASHAEAVERMRDALQPGTRRLVSAVNYTEVLIGPLQKAGTAGAGTVDAMLVRFDIETIPVDMALARRAAAVRADGCSFRTPTPSQPRFTPRSVDMPTSASRASTRRF